MPGGFTRGRKSTHVKQLLRCLKENAQANTTCLACRLDRIDYHCNGLDRGEHLFTQVYPAILCHLSNEVGREYYLFPSTVCTGVAHDLPLVETFHQHFHDPFYQPFFAGSEIDVPWSQVEPVHAGLRMASAAIAYHGVMYTIHIWELHQTRQPVACRHGRTQ